MFTFRESDLVALVMLDFDKMNISIYITLALLEFSFIYAFAMDLGACFRAGYHNIPYFPPKGIIRIKVPTYSYLVS